jgi:tRNA A22 N-methylase
MPYNRIADIGAGQGRLSHALLERPERVVFATERHLPGFHELLNCSRPNPSLHLLMGDGLDAVIGQDIDMTVIAGMGPRAIERILLKHHVISHSQFIVQPMHGIFMFHRYLCSGAWEIFRAGLVCEQGRIYGTWQIQPSASTVPFRSVATVPDEFRGDSLYFALLQSRVAELSKRLKATAAVQNSQREIWHEETALLLTELDGTRD